MDATDGYLDVLADAARRDAEAEVWVAAEDHEQGSVILGSVTFCPVGSTYREVARDDEAEFRMLAVAAEARGRGVGAALVGRCVGLARELAYAGVRMSTLDRMSTAHRVYERLGFTRAPEDDWIPVPGFMLLAYVLRFPVDPPAQSGSTEG